jgi:hypothetical protein
MAKGSKIPASIQYAQQYIAAHQKTGAGSSTISTGLVAKETPAINQRTARLIRGYNRQAAADDDDDKDGGHDQYDHMQGPAMHRDELFVERLLGFAAALFVFGSLVWAFGYCGMRTKTNSGVAVSDLSHKHGGGCSDDAAHGAYQIRRRSRAEYSYD